MNYPESFKKLVDSLKLLPGIGEKTAERYAFSILNMDRDKIEDFSESIKNIKNNITTCKICGSMCESNNCMICEDKLRESGIVCVVENQKNVFIFEKIGIFKT